MNDSFFLSEEKKRMFPFSFYFLLIYTTTSPQIKNEHSYRITSCTTIKIDINVIGRKVETREKGC